MKDLYYHKLKYEYQGKIAILCNYGIIFTDIIDPHVYEFSNDFVGLTKFVTSRALGFQDRTIFTRKPCLRLKTENHNIELIVKPDDTFNIKYTDYVEPVNHKVTIEDLMHQLPADHFIEYLKQNGISFGEVISK